MTLDILIPKITAVIFGISAIVGLVMHVYYEIVESDPFFEQDCAMKLIYWGKWGLFCTGVMSGLFLAIFALIR